MPVKSTVPLKNSGERIERINWLKQGQMFNPFNLFLESVYRIFVTFE